MINSNTEVRNIIRSFYIPRIREQLGEDAARGEMFWLVNQISKAFARLKEQAIANDNVVLKHSFLIWQVEPDMNKYTSQPFDRRSLSVFTNKLSGEKYWVSFRVVTKEALKSQVE